MRGGIGGAVLMVCGVLAASAAPAACPDARARHQAMMAAAAGDLPDRAERMQRWEDYVAAVAGCGDAELELDALRAWSDDSRRTVDPDSGMRADERRYTLAVRIGHTRHRAEAARNLGNILAQRGEMDPGVLRLQEAASLFQAIGETLTAADVHSELSRWHRRDGAYLAALTDEQAALALRRQLPEQPNAWRSLLNLAVLYEQLEQAPEARRRYGEALDEATRQGREGDVAIVLASYAGFLNDFGAAEGAQALAMAERAHAIEVRLGRQVQRNSALMQIGRAQFNLGRLDAAEKALGEAWLYAQELPQEALRAHVLFRYGELAVAQGRLAEARQRLEAARDLYLKQGNRHRLTKVYAVLEPLYLQLDDRLAAATAGRERYRLRDELLGASATARLGELLNRFELSEERLRNEQLQREKAETELRLAQGQRDTLLIALVAGAIFISMLLLAWRYLSVRKLIALLRSRSLVMEKQAAELAEANRKLTEQSERLYLASVTDALTGLRNRGYAMDLLVRMLEAPAAEPQRVTLMLIDIDHFKAINDRHGHPAGDLVLQQVAQTLQQSVPEGTEVCRVGGEEFMIISHRLDPLHAQALAERLRQRVRALRVDTGRSELNLTVSIGLCLVGQLGEPGLRQAYAAADRALYLAKQEGRDRVRVAA